MKVYKGYVTPGQMDWRVTVDDGPLSPRTDLVNHSPDGFAWGYGGSGPAQLALALLADATGDDQYAMDHYQWFKRRIVEGLDKDKTWTMTSSDIHEVMTRNDETRRNHFSWGAGDVEHLD